MASTDLLFTKVLTVNPEHFSFQGKPTFPNYRIKRIGQFFLKKKVLHNYCVIFITRGTCIYGSYLPEMSHLLVSHLFLTNEKSDFNLSKFSIFTGNPKKKKKDKGIKTLQS